jgi:hypothetical protein
LKLEYDKLLINFVFNINLRCYNEEVEAPTLALLAAHRALTQQQQMASMANEAAARENIRRGNTGAGASGGGGSGGGDVEAGGSLTAKN